MANEVIIIDGKKYRIVESVLVKSYDKKGEYQYVAARVEPV